MLQHFKHAWFRLILEILNRPFPFRSVETPQTTQGATGSHQTRQTKTSTPTPHPTPYPHTTFNEADCCAYTSSTNVPKSHALGPKYAHPKYFHIQRHARLHACRLSDRQTHTCSHAQTHTYIQDIRIFILRRFYHIQHVLTISRRDILPTNKDIHLHVYKT